MNKIDKIDRELEKAREKAAEWPAELMAFLNDPANRFAASGQNGPKQETSTKEDNAHEEN